jgi:signal peptidase II
VARPPATRSRRVVAAVVFAAFALLALDLGTKAWATHALSAERTEQRPALCTLVGYFQRRPTEPLARVGSFFELTYAENCGAAFSVLSETPVRLGTIVFGGAGILATLALVLAFARGRGGPLFPWAVAPTAAGVLGNLVDRLRFGYVVDFIHFEWPGVVVYPIFYVGVVLIAIVVALLLLDAIVRTAAVDPALLSAARTDARGTR